MYRIVIAIFCIFLLAGCTPSVSTARKIVEADDERLMQSLHMRLLIADDPAGASEEQRLAVEVINPNERDIEFPISCGVPDGMVLSIVEAPQVKYVCLLGGQPIPTAARARLWAGGGDIYRLMNDHAFMNPRNQDGSEKQSAWKPAGKIWHLRATWHGNTSDPIAVKLD